MTQLKNMKNFYVLIFVLLLANNSIESQTISKEHYQRAVSFMYDNYNNKTVFNLLTTVSWFENNLGLWFIDHSTDGKKYKTFDFDANIVSELFDHTKLAQALSSILEKDIDPTQIAIDNIERYENKNLKLTIDNKEYTIDLNSYTLSEIVEEKQEEVNLLESKSPDGKWIAYTKDYNLYIKSTETEEKFQLSTKGKKGYEYASWYGWFDKMEGENGERPPRFFVNWSEDSKWIATSIVDTRSAEKMYLLDYSIDSLYKPKLLSYYRGSPGDTTMVHLTPVFYNIDSKKEITTTLPTGTHINSVGIEWHKDSGKLLANYSERGYKKEVLKIVDLNDETEEKLIELNSLTNIDNFWYRYLPELQKVIYLAEESGWRQLYVTDLKTNTTKHLTNGEYYINSIVHTDESNKMIYFMASGVDGAMNPYHQQLFKVDFKGKKSLLTPEKVHHSVDFHKEGNYFVDNYSTINIPTKTVLREAKTGKIITQLTEAKLSDDIPKSWKAPEVFELVAKDGKTTIYGALWKPTDFDPNKKYPIIDVSYTGPHTQVFPKGYNGIFWNQSLAEFGFVVMLVDGLGTSGRSKEFHDHSYKNMGKNLEDHVLAIKYLGEKYSWLDESKVGIYGHSAGGYDTGRAMLVFPDVYRVGVASSADHDFRMEKAWWPEMYQGWPVDDTYEEVSNITNAANLKGKLLLVHGGLDDNVNPSATFKLAEALVKADKEFDLLILPSQRHGYVGDYRKYFIKKRWNYFVQHLLGVQPLWDFKWE